MKNQKQFKSILVSFSVFLLTMTFLASPVVNAQTTIDLENHFYTFNPNYPYEHVTEGVYKELLIAPSTQATHLYLQVKGGDGGYNLKTFGGKNEGGNGAVTSGLFQIGTGSGQIPPGSTLRLVPGQRGRSHYGDSGQSGRGSGGGGGGGSAAVLLPAGKSNWNTESIVLMVAGGGGGGASRSAGRPGNTEKTGRGGYDTCGNDLNNGGSSNNPGNTSNDASPGAAMDKNAGLGGASCNSGYTNASGAQKGWPTGGTGSECLCWGGFGFGGGGSGNTAGGGGGGYSGGGPGYYLGGGNLSCPGGAGGGGGGGSYVTSRLNIEQKSIVGSGTTGSPSDGFITYGLLEVKSIKFAYNSSKCVDDNGSGTSNGNNIQSYDCNGTSAQKWLINTDDRTIHSLLDFNKCLDLDDSRTDNGSNIQLWDCNGAGAQHWVYNGLYKTIHSGVNSDKCFDATNGSSTTSNVNIQLWDCNYTSNNMKWTIYGATTVSNVSNRKHIVPTLATSFALHSHTGAESGSNIQLWTKDNTNTAAQWYFDGLAIKMRDHQNLCIDLSSSNTNNGNNIQLYNCNDTNAQKWLYDGMNQSIRSVVNPGKCMQIEKNSDGVYGKRSNIDIRDCDGSAAQQFLIQG